jgi:hypothetical protein
MIRYTSPSATAGPFSAAFASTEPDPPTPPPNPEPPLASVAMYASTLTPISVYVTSGSPPAYARRTTRVLC